MSTPISHPAHPRTERIARLLASNDPPLDIEEQTYRVVITQGQTRLVEIDEQIADIRAALEALLLQRDQLQAHINDHKAVMNPMRRLPADILSVIFGFYAPPVDVSVMAPKQLTHDSLNVEMGPWILGRVCRRWRCLVEDLPLLWSGLNVAFDPKYSGNRPLHHSQYLLGRHLRNAKNVPISISLFSRQNIKSSHAVLHTLAPYSDQWKNLRLVFREASSFKCMAYIKGLLSSLECLHIGKMIGGPSERVPSTPFDAFSFAPKLHEVNVKSIPRICRWLSLPWSQITTYNWTRFPGDGTDTLHHLETLQHMPNLAQCFLECYDIDGSGIAESASLPKVQLPCLRKLQLLEASPKDSSGLAHMILACLSAPALQDLIIECLDSLEFVGVGAVSEFIIRSACPLLKLHLPSVPTLTEHALLHLLRHIPTLENLALSSVVLTEDFLEQLKPSSSMEPLRIPVAPSLHTIKLEYLSALINWQPHLFFDMIQRRWHVHDVHSHSGGGHVSGMPPLVRLQSVELVFWREVPQSLLDRPDIDRLRSEGLHIVLRHTTS